MPNSKKDPSLGENCKFLDGFFAEPIYFTPQVTDDRRAQRARSNALVAGFSPPRRWPPARVRS